MKERIKALRKSLGLNQTKFGQELGVSMSSVTKWETGENDVSESVIRLICKRFSVSDTWLRTGEGEMFEPRTREEEIAAFVHDVCGPDGSAFQRRLITLLSRLSPEEWGVLEKIADELNEKGP